MRTRPVSLPAAAAAAAALWLFSPGRASAALFVEDFDADSTAEWNVNQPGGGNASDNFADLFFDYSTVGIPSAPNSVGGTTRGMKLEANVSSGAFSGISASPIGQSFTGDYTLTADVWQNFNGPPPAGGNGSTQITWAGIGTNGTTAQFPATSVQGVGFGASGEGGTTQDYRAYVDPGAPLLPSTGSYAAGTTDSPAASDSRQASDPYYANNGFGNETAPAAQVSMFPQQGGTTAAGTQGLAWHEWEIQKVGDTVTWRIDGVLISTVDVSNEPFGGDNIFLGYFDINATSSNDPNDRSLLFGLFDNVVVEIVPEPGALSVLTLAGAGLLLLLLRRRRRRRAVPALRNSGTTLLG